MNNNEFIVKLLAQLDKQNSKKQIDADIKQLESVIRKIGLIGTFSSGSTKKELNAYIAQLGNQLKHIKLQAKIDGKQLRREINETLRSLSFADIDVGINENKTKTKVKKVIAEAKAVIDKNPLSINIEVKKDKLNNQLTTYLNKNSKIKESSILLGEADRLRKTFSAIGDSNSVKDATEQFQLFKSEVVATGFAGKSTTDKIKSMVGNITKIGSAFGVASLAMNQFFKSERNLREIDTVLTEISKTSELTKKQLVELGDASFDTANKYGQLAKNYLLGVQEMARSGYEDKAKELGEVSLLAQSAGDMSAEMANNYILATDAAYKYGGSIEKLTSALDGANYVSNKNSASLTDIADGIRVSASYAANAGVKIDELTAAEATMIATTKRSGSEMGRAFRSILLNLQQVKGEFDGEIIDEESLKKVEARCHSLGVELETMTNEGAKLRNPMEVLKELSQVYNSLPDSSVEKQGLISDLGGKYHANALTALLSRWDLYEKMLSEYSQGSGSALVEAYKTADSWEGRLNQLQNSWDSFVNSLTNKDAVKGGISFLDGTIQAFEKLTDTIGTIPTLLTAVNASMSTLNKDYGITQVYNQDTGKADIQGNLMGIDITAFKAQKKHFEEAAEAITQWNDKVKAGKGDFEQLGISIINNNAQLKAYLATTSKDAPASLAGYKSYLNAAGVSTDALRLKTVLLTSALSFGIGVAIQAAVSGIIKLIQAQEEARQSAQETAEAYTNSTSAIKDYTKRYEELHSALLAAKGNEEETYHVKQQLLDLQTELNDKFGDEYGKLNLVTDAYTNQTEALKAYNKEAAKTLLNDISRSVQNKAVNKMTGKQLYNLNVGGISGYSDEGKALQELLKKYEGKGISSLIDEYGSLHINLTADPTSAEQTINAFMTDVSVLANKLGDEHIFDEVLDISKSAKDEAQKTIADWGDIYEKTLLGNIALDDELSSGMEKATQAVKDYNEAVLRSEDPYNDESVQKAYVALQNIKSLIQNDDAWDQYKSVMDSIWNSADTKVFDLNDAIQSDIDGISQFVDQIKAIDNIDLKAKVDSHDADIYDELTKYADQYQISVEELIEALIKLGYVQEHTETPDAQDVKLFNIQDEGTAKTIDEFQKKMSALSAAIEKVRNNDLSSSELLDLKQEFPELVDVTDNLDKTLSELVDKTLADVVDSLGAAGASSDLINMFQTLADEAKGIASNWTGTFAVFDNGTSKMETLAEFVKALGNQYTITAAEARKFAEVFPELLALGEVTSSGLMQFDKEVVENFINGKQIEIQADTDAQIAQLENRKAVLEAKKAAAQAALDLIAAQASGEVEGTNEKNEKLAEAEKNLTQYLVDLGVEQGNADAAVKELMAGNIQEYDRIVAEVADNADFNLTGSINDASKNVNIQAHSMIDSLYGIAQQANNAAMAVLSIGTGNPTQAIKFGIDTAVEVGKKFHAAETAEDFKRLVNEEINIDDYKRAEITMDLQLDIDNYQKSIDDINSQIALLKAGQGKSLDDYVNDLNKSSRSDKSKKESEKKKEEFDWIQTALDYMTRQRQEMLSITEDENASYSDQLAALKELLALDKERIAKNKEALDNYQSQWEEITKQIKEAFGEEDGNAFISKIMKGDASVEGWKDIFEFRDPEDESATAEDKAIAKKVELLKNATQIHKSFTEQEDAYKEALESETEVIQKIFETRLNMIKAHLDKVTEKMNQVENTLKMNDITGRVNTEEDYENLIRLADEQIGLYHDQMRVLDEQLDSLEEGSAEWYNTQSQIAGCRNAIAQCELNQAEWNEQIKRLPVERLEKYLNILQNVKQDLDNFLSEQSALGIQPTLEQYKQQISLSQEQITALLKQQDVLKGLLSDYQYGSEKYNDTANEIQGIDDSISSLIQNQQEWNEAIRQIPLNQMQKYIDTLGNARTDLENHLNEQNARGIATTIDQYKELNTVTLQQLGALANQKTMLTELLGEYDKDSERYTEVANQIQDIENEMSGLVQNQYEWNEAILQMPLDRLSEANDNLSKYSNALSDMLGDYDTALNAVNAALSKELDLTNDLREKTEDEYEEKIKPLQDRLDLLNKENEARQIQLNLEQAQYDLDRAKEQKSTRVIRDGEIGYEANIDDLRNANKTKADAELEKTRYDLQTQIDSLTEERDKLFEGYDEEIERLTEIQDRWSSIKEEIQGASDAIKANEFFGNGWKDKIISGNDQDLYDMFKGMYENTQAQKEQIEDQISSNERVSEMMELIVKQYQDGSITYTEAVSRISDLTSSMQDGYSALEQLSGLMNMDGIKGLADIANNSQNVVLETLKQLSDYMGIVESNSASMGDYTSSWDEMKSSLSDQMEVLGSMAVSMESFQEYLTIARENSELISQYTSTWEEMQKSIAEQVEALKKAAEELERLANEKHSSSGSYDSDSGGGAEYNGWDVSIYYPPKDDVEAGPGYIEDVIAGDPDSVESWESGNTGGADQELTDYVNDRLSNRHNGILGGLIGTESNDKEREKDLKTLATTELKPNEEYVKVLDGEAFFTKDQQIQLLTNISNLQKMPVPTPNIPYNILETREMGTTVTVTMGDVSLPNVQDVDGFARAMYTQFPSALRQAMHRR